jgi:protein-S-isoprenylcysteine O-methyltransferase Ste14
MKITAILRAGLGFLFFALLVPAGLFAAFGGWSWPAAWAYSVLYLLSVLLSRLLVWRKHPDTLAERSRFAEQSGVSRDRWLAVLTALLLPLVSTILSGLDHRYGWSAPLPFWLRALGGVMVALSFAWATWAMLENRYFSAVARIQTERGQQVVSSGPYRVIRHPAYASSLLAWLGAPLLLNSLWACLPGALCVLLIAYRTRLEDKLLIEGLPGYRDYAARTRWRLIPGVW